MQNIHSVYGPEIVFHIELVEPQWNFECSIFRRQMWGPLKGDRKIGTFG